MKNLPRAHIQTSGSPMKRFLCGLLAAALCALVAAPALAVPAGTMVPDQSAARIRLQRLRSLSFTPALAAPVTPSATITLNAAGAVSAVNGNCDHCASVTWTDARIWSGPSMVVNSTYYGQCQNVHYNGSPGSNVCRERWQTDAPNLGITLRDNAGQFSLLIDGQSISGNAADGRAYPYVVGNTGGGRELQVNWGSDVLTFNAAGIGSNGTSVSVGGSGYVAGDTFSLNDSCSTHVQGRVNAISAGAITNWSITNPGVCSAAPTMPIGILSTSGVGTSATLNFALGLFHSTRQLHSYELRGSGGAAFAGLQIGVHDTIAPMPPKGPLFVGVGDSITEGSSPSRVAGTWFGVQQELLGNDNYVFSAEGSTGWLTASLFEKLGSRLVSDLQPLVPSDRTQPVVFEIALGINDNAQNSAALQAEVTADVSTILSWGPNVYVIVFGPWQGSTTGQQSVLTTEETFIKAGAQAATGWDEARRTAFIPTMSANILKANAGTACTNPTTATAGNSSLYIGCNDPHPHQAGHDYLGTWAAQQVENVIKNQWTW